MMRSTANQKIHIVFLWVKMLCRLVDGNNVSEEHSTTIIQYEYGNSTFLQNVGTKLPEDRKIPSLP
jgi:hypothetical protein